jgi:hypothetical protein
MLGDWLASGQLISVELSPENPWLKLPGRTDPNDPCEQIYLEELARSRQEDLARTLRDYEAEDQKCSSSSSTLTT